MACQTVNGFVHYFRFFPEIRRNRNRPMRVKIIRALFPCFGLFALALGCGPRLPYFPPEVHHIKKAWSLCGAYKANHDGKVPKDIEAVKKWAIQEGKATEEDFISPRDKQLYQAQFTPPPMG